MTKKELIMSTLEEKMGYCPEVDEDGDIRVAYQLKTIYVMTGDDDEQYVSVMLPQFHEIEDGKETLALAVCNKMTRELKLLKSMLTRRSRMSQRPASSSTAARSRWNRISKSPSNCLVSSVLCSEMIWKSCRKYVVIKICGRKYYL